MYGLDRQAAVRPAGSGPYAATGAPGTPLSQSPVSSPLMWRLLCSAWLPCIFESKAGDDGESRLVTGARARPPTQLTSFSPCLQF